eukprot:gene8587-10173_t
MSGKHTLRYSRLAHCCFPLDLMISGVVRQRVTHDDGSKEVAISSVDFLFADTDNFILNDPHDSNCRYDCKCRNANLNKNKLWETVLAELESTCVSKSERVNKHHELGETVYTVPVIGHKVFLPPATDEDFELGAYREIRDSRLGSKSTNERLVKSTLKKIKLNPAQFMYWEGKYYDTTKVYAYKLETNGLKPLGDCSTPKPSMHTAVSNTNLVEFTKNITFHNSLHKRAHQYCRIQHQGADPLPFFYSYRGGNGGWEQKGSNDYLEINLGYPRSITHIGTLGENPITTVFPTRKIVGRKRLRRFRENADDQEIHFLKQDGNGVRMTRFAQHVKVLTQEEQALRWVTSYEVHYRHAVTNKWTLLAVTSANTDAFTEHILDLTPYFNAKDGLFTQYLRIKPVEFHNHPVMRVAVYGVDSKQSNKPTNDHNSAALASNDDVPTVTYTIIHSSPRAGPIYVRDGLPRYYKSNHYRYYNDDAPRAMKRKDFQGLMVDYGKTGYMEAKADNMHGIDYKMS